jgi:hypothetical protein
VLDVSGIGENMFLEIGVTLRSSTYNVLSRLNLSKNWLFQVL